MFESREAESFTASADCPSCGVVAVHYLDSPRREPMGDDPVSKTMRRMALMMDCVSARRMYDPPGTTVARICTSCGHRWGQR